MNKTDNAVSLVCFTTAIAFDSLKSNHYFELIASKSENIRWCGGVLHILYHKSIMFSTSKKKKIYFEAQKVLKAMFSVK